MIRLHLNASVLKSLNFCKEDKTLEIEFKNSVKASECIDIPISMLKEYVDSIKLENGLENMKHHHSNLRIVHSKFKAS